MQLFMSYPTCSDLSNYLAKNAFLKNLIVVIAYTVYIIVLEVLPNVNACYILN